MSRTAGSRLRPVRRALLDDDPLVVAPLLLNMLLAHDGRVARIVEVEAYAGDRDPAAHTYRGQTARNAAMFGPPGHLYVYFSYGMHWCANVVCGRPGVGWAVLLRAAAPVAGVEAMRAARPAARVDRDLLRGPGRLCQALGLARDHDGADLIHRDGTAGTIVGDDRVALLSDGTPPPTDPGVSRRIGITKAADNEWRWFVKEAREVSGPRPRAERTSSKPRG